MFHLNYAKVGYLCLQDTLNLEEKITAEELTKFADSGFFTIKRTDWNMDRYGDRANSYAIDEKQAEV